MKRHSIIIVTIQNTFPLLADLHLKFTEKAQRVDEKLECRAAVGCNKNL